MTKKTSFEIYIGKGESPTKKKSKIKEPMLREISFEGNMPSTYEKNLKKALAKGK